MKAIETPKAPAALGPYTQGMEADGGLIFTSGQIGLIPPAGDTIEAQAEQAIRNVGAILEAAGAGYTDVLKTVCFLADMDDFAAFNAVYAKYFTGKPARSCVAVKSLPKGMLCEVEAIAQRH